MDKANTTKYGNPEITKVNIGVRNNPAILISGHDLVDLEQLLEQTKDSGVDVYTHGEMLPAHYPFSKNNFRETTQCLRKQLEEFEILMVLFYLLQLHSSAEKEEIQKEFQRVRPVILVANICPDGNGKKIFQRLLSLLRLCLRL